MRNKTRIESLDECPRCGYTFFDEPMQPSEWQPGACKHCESVDDAALATFVEDAREMMRQHGGDRYKNAEGDWVTAIIVSPEPVAHFARLRRRES